ncbi:lysophospholipid acyltransferase family protein [Deltaproteobacteria bacterium TL4]
MSLKSKLSQWFLSKELQQLTAKLPDTTGSLGFDPWGFNPETAKISMAITKILYDHYFRVETIGLENVLTKGRLLLIANHSGQLPFDSAMIGVALATNPRGPRMPKSMIERYSPTLPYVGNFLNEVGGVVGDPVNCIKMLRREELVMVFPEGIKGSTKSWHKRYQLQHFGSGFMRIAMETETPIIPVGVIGCEEMMPGLGSFDALAKILNIPKVPITIPLPLPVKIRLYFGKPLSFKGDFSNEEETEAKVRQVKSHIQNLLQQGLKEREGLF